MDLTATIAPRSDQINADDLISGPVTVTITEVRAGSAEQPVDVIVAEFPGRAYRPSKSMRRVMVSAWGKEASAYAGHRLTLFRNPDITFGRDRVGGIEIAAMSHIEKPLTVALTATRGKRKNFTVKPLVEPVASPKVEFDGWPSWEDAIKGCEGDVDLLRRLHSAAKSDDAPADVLEAIIQAGKNAAATEGN